MNDVKKLERNRRYRENHREEIREKEKAYYWQNKERVRKGNSEAVKRHFGRIKHAVFLHYSKTDPPHCMCNGCLWHTENCVAENLIVLSIDHINGDGGKHRKELNIHGGKEFYKWLVKNNYPEGYQVLCMNCQWSKKSNEQPHKY